MMGNVSNLFANNRNLWLHIGSPSRITLSNPMGMYERLPRSEWCSSSDSLGKSSAVPCHQPTLVVNWNPIGIKSIANYSEWLPHDHGTFCQKHRGLRWFPSNTLPSRNRSPAAPPPPLRPSGDSAAWASHLRASRNTWPSWRHMIVSKRGSQDGDPPKATTKGHFQDLKPPISGVTKSKLYQIVPSRSTCCRGPCTTEATDESEQSCLRDGKLMAVTSQAQRLSYPHNQWGGTFIYEYLWISMNQSSLLVNIRDSRENFQT